MVFFGAKAEAGGPMMSVFKVKLATPPEQGFFSMQNIFQPLKKKRWDDKQNTWKLYPYYCIPSCGTKTEKSNDSQIVLKFERNKSRLIKFQYAFFVNLICQSCIDEKSAGNKSKTI